jgi:hypothetical protein
MATMKNLMGLRISVLLGAVLTVMLALVLSLGASEASAGSRPTPDDEGHSDGSTGGTGSSTTSTTEAPNLSGLSSPGPWATGVSIDTNVTITFTEPMDPTTVNSDTFKLYPSDSSQSIPATVSMVPDTNQRTFVLDPYGSDAGRLDKNRQYTWKITKGMEDQDDGLYLPYGQAYSFTTAATSTPYVKAVSPPDGATGVPTNSNMKVTFSDPMDPATINSNTVKVTVIYYLYDRYTNYYNYVREVRSTTISKDPNDPSGRTWVVDPRCCEPTRRSRWRSARA